ncbi:MAG: hypothetical protein Kow0080_19340 [Candidatus Promineifilaceae bacterium]
MSDEQTPSVEEIKARLQAAEEIPVNNEAAKAGSEPIDITEELRKVGKQFAETLQTAWSSEEWQRIEKEMREGLRSFADEVDKVFAQIRESDALNKVRSEAIDVKEKVDKSDLGQKTKTGFVNGLRWLSEELGKMADRFSAADKPENDDSPPSA